MRRFILCFLWLVLPVLAALPPMDPEKRKERAELIVVGLVEDVETRVVEVRHGKNTVYKLTVVVQKAEKGELTGKRLLATCWRPLERPAGWAGPQGQNQIPSKGDEIRLFLRDAGEGAYEMLEPNGWEMRL